MSLVPNADKIIQTPNYLQVVISNQIQNSCCGHGDTFSDNETAI